MPELPDLENFGVNLNKALAGKKVTKLSVFNKQKLKVSEEILKKNIEKQTLEKVERVGKELHFKNSKKSVLGLHLMLHGDYTFLKVRTIKSIRSSH